MWLQRGSAVVLYAVSRSLANYTLLGGDSRALQGSWEWEWGVDHQ